MKKNSNLLGMDQGASGAPALFFLGWARPKMSKLQARKLSSLDRSQALGYNGI